METTRPMTQEEVLRCRRVVRISRDDLDLLTLCLPLDCQWGDPITPELVQHIINAAEQQATDRAVDLAHGFSVGDRIEHGGRPGTIRVIRNPWHPLDRCTFLLDMDDKSGGMWGSIFWVQGTRSFKKIVAGEEPTA